MRVHHRMSANAVKPLKEEAVAGGHWTRSWGLGLPALWWGSREQKPHIRGT